MIHPPIVRVLSITYSRTGGELARHICILRLHIQVPQNYSKGRGGRASLVDVTPERPGAGIGRRPTSDFSPSEISKPGHLYIPTFFYHLNVSSFK